MVLMNGQTFPVRRGSERTYGVNERTNPFRTSRVHRNQRNFTNTQTVTRAFERQHKFS